VNQVEFVIARSEYGSGDLDGIEPVIDGLSLVDVVKHADGEISYAGRTFVAEALAELRAVLKGESDGHRVQLLGCACGIDECSGLLATMSVREDTVVWSDLRAMRQRPGPDLRKPYDELEGFVFDLEQFKSALDLPVRHEEPLREAADLMSLAAGLPRDHAEWLRAMTMAFDRDFLTPYADESIKTVVASALQAFTDAGMPMTDEAIESWMRGGRLMDEAIDRYIAWFHEQYATPG
jgi:hypothetical protein